MLAHAYLPRDVVDYDRAAIGYTAVAHVDDDGAFGRLRVGGVIGQRQHLLGGHGIVKEGVEALALGVADGREERQPLYGDDGGDEGWYLVDIAEQHHDGCGRGGSDALHGCVKFLARLHIEAYVGVVENQQVGRVKELVDYEHLAQFAAREGVDRLVLVAPELHPLGETAPRGMVEAVAHHLAYGGHLAVHA